MKRLSGFLKQVRGISCEELFLYLFHEESMIKEIIPQFPCLKTNMAFLLKLHDPAWKISPVSKISLAEHPQVHDKLFKISISNSSAPSSYVLRVPFARQLAVAITEHSLRHLAVPQKWLIPLIPKEKILLLDESAINRAFLVMAEKKSVLLADSLGRLHNLSREVQEMMAEELCTLAYVTGFTDLRLENLLYLEKLTLIDTEPLNGELILKGDEDKFAKNMALGKQGRYYTKMGLQTLLDSSKFYNLPIFAERARKHLLAIG